MLPGCHRHFLSNSHICLWTCVTSKSNFYHRVQTNLTSFLKQISIVESFLYHLLTPLGSFLVNNNVVKISRLQLINNVFVTNFVGRMRTSYLVFQRRTYSSKRVWRQEGCSSIALEGDRALRHSSQLILCVTVGGVMSTR